MQCKTVCSVLPVCSPETLKEGIAKTMPSICGQIFSFNTFCSKHETCTVAWYIPGS